MKREDGRDVVEFVFPRRSWTPIGKLTNGSSLHVCVCLYLGLHSVRMCNVVHEYVIYLITNIHVSDYEDRSPERR